jgi:hypothetical protein
MTWVGCWLSWTPRAAPRAGAVCVSGCCARCGRSPASTAAWTPWRRSSPTGVCVCVCGGGGLLLLRTPREWGVGGVSMRTFVLVMRAPDSQWGVATPRQAGAGAAAGGAECGRVRLRRLVTVLRRLLTVLRCVLTVLRCVLTVLRCDVERELSALARVGAQARTG